jgi:hypothetical protein
MLRNLLIGAGAMTLCLLLQSSLLVQATRHYARRALPATFQDAIKRFVRSRLACDD